MIALLLCGPSLSGKSTAARLLAREFSALIVSADAINATRGIPFGAEGLAETAWEETLRLQLDEFTTRANEGHSLIVDDTLCYRWLRDRWREHAEAVGLRPVLLVFRVDRDEIYRRHRVLTESHERRVLSHERLADHLDRFEWPTAEEAHVAAEPHLSSAELCERVRAEAS